MRSKVMHTNNPTYIITGIKPNKVVNVISITLLTLMLIFACKLLIHVFSPDISPFSNEITIILSSCLAVNIVAYLIFRRCQLFMNNMVERGDVKSGNLNRANKNVRIEIAERKRSEANLRRSEEKYWDLMENAGEGILLIDGNGNFLEANKKMKELLGFSEAELLTMNLIQILSGEELERTRAVFEEVVQKGEGYLIDGWIIGKDDKKVPVDIAGSKVEYAGKTIIKGIFNDITERQKAETERLRFSKLESLGTLAGGIAHDFNNILTAILGNIGLAKQQGQIEDRVLEKLTKAEKACFQAQSLTKQLQIFAKGGAPFKETVSISDLLKESAGFALAGSKTRCEFSFFEDLWLVEADGSQINQAIANLLVNADQAMSKSGTIKISAENVHLGRETPLPLPEGKYVRITITDQGIGISSENLGKIFDPYFTTKEKGSGLGLATAYSIIKNHSGYITAESTPGMGTTFEIYLPGQEARVRTDEEAIIKPMMGQGRVLVMDYEEMIREVLGGMLSCLGYEAEFARDGGEAIEMFVKAQESGQAFAAVILDLTVPGGMGGKEAIKELLKIDPQVKAIVSSGYSDDPIMADFQKYGFGGVIVKPYKIPELGKVLNDALTGNE